MDSISLMVPFNPHHKFLKYILRLFREKSSIIVSIDIIWILNSYGYRKISTWNRWHRFQKLMGTKCDQEEMYLILNVSNVSPFREMDQVEKFVWLGMYLEATMYLPTSGLYLTMNGYGWACSAGKCNSLWSWQQYWTWLSHERSGSGVALQMLNK